MARFAAAVSSPGYVGEQFALPDAIEALRAARRNADDSDLVVVVSDYDPLRIVHALSGGVVTTPLRTEAAS